LRHNETRYRNDFPEPNRRGSQSLGPKGAFHLNQIQPKAVEDWLHTMFDSWWTMHGVRAIMTRIFNYAEGHGLFSIRF
jgi:hypothetical protein